MSTSNESGKIKVQTVVNAPMDKVWKLWTEAEHIKNWCSATDTWHVPSAENDLRVGGHFKTVMAAKDGSMQFDFGGEYGAVEEKKYIEYGMADGRHVELRFSESEEGVLIEESFDPETENSRELQQQGWQSILNNFKKYVEESA